MDDHYYSKDGKQYERVTRILDYFSNPELVAWKVKVGQKEAGKVSRIALKCGKAVDEMIRASRIPKLKDSDEIKSCLKAWKSWKERIPPGMILSGQTSRSFGIPSSPWSASMKQKATCSLICLTASQLGICKAVRS